MPEPRDYLEGYLGTEEGPRWSEELPELRKQKKPENSSNPKIEL